MFGPAACAARFTPLGSRPQGPLSSKEAFFASLRQPHLAPLSRLARRRGVVTRAAAQPLLRAAGRLAARALPAQFLLARLLTLVRSGSGARLGPVLLVGLLAYSVGVTLYAANNRSGRTQSSSAVAAAAPSAPADAPPSTRNPPAATALAAISLPAPESPAEAVAAAVVAPPAAPKEKKERREKKPKEKQMCKVCGGTGTVAYENHMTAYDGTVCPCCLGKGLVKKGMKGDLISCLLSWDP